MHSTGRLIGLLSLSRYMDVYGVMDLLLKRCRLKTIGGNLHFLLLLAHFCLTCNATGPSNSRQSARGCASVTFSALS